jgi:hypothetical protein
MPVAGAIRHTVGTGRYVPLKVAEAKGHPVSDAKAGIIQAPKREALRRLNANMKMVTQLATHEAIQQIADYIRSQPADYIKSASNHFTNFDPSRPDYSRLAGDPSKS